MPSTYTVNLGIEKPATGEQSGTWGDTVNDNSNILDEAINGAVTITLSSAGSSGSPNSITITNGASSTGRNKWIEFGDGGDLGAAAYVQLTPNDAEKICNIRNSLSGNRSIFIFQGNYSASNDLEIAAGTDVVVKFNGGGTGATVVNVYANLKVDGIVATTADINGGTVDGTVIGGASAAALTATTVVANTSVNIAGDGATVTGIKDEDNMASNSATKLATQQSIKAYVDSQVGTVDTLAEILANGNTTGSTDIDVAAAQKVQFRDAAIYINSSVDGQLDIVADTEIQIAATTIDINGAIVASGDIAAASLDISGNVDIDGVLNVDAIDIDGAVQLDNTLTVGVDDTGYDVKFFGAAGGSFLLWDESANNLSLAGASTLNVAGVVTANAGIVVDNIAIDGNAIDCISGDLTLDVAGDIILDAGGAEIKLLDDGTQFGDIYTSSNNLYIQSSISDKDLKFEVNDGGSIVTALTLDGSAAGAATFNSNIVTANGKVIVGSTSSVFTNSIISATSSTGPVVGAQSTAAAHYAGGFHNTASGAVDLVAFYTGSGALAGSIETGSSGEFIIESSISNKDLVFKGNDGGSIITALTLDMSEAGEATFNSDIKLGDGKVARFGAGQDFRISFDGTNAVLQNVASDSDIQFIGKDGGSDITALTLDMSAAGAATFNAGITVGGNSTFLAPNIDITADDARLLIEEADGTNIVWLGDITGAGVGGMFLYNHGGTATTQLRSDSASLIGHGLTVDGAATSTVPLILKTNGGAANTVRPQISMFSGGTNSYHISTIRSNLSNDPYGLVFTENATERFRIDNGGRAIIGGGVTLGNGQTYAAANTLDDYEEGTWSPVWVGTTSTQVTNMATYTKIGNIVHLNLYISSISPATSSDMQIITGLPFTVAGSNFYGAGSIAYSAAFDVEGIGLLAHTNSNYLYFHYIDGTSGSSPTRNNWNGIASSGLALIMSISYRTDA